jgi:hypothetical protein
VLSWLSIDLDYYSENYYSENQFIKSQVPLINDVVILINSIQPLQTPLRNKNNKTTYKMASEQVPNPEKGVKESSGVNQALAGLSLSSRGVHADDGIAAHRAVAPAMHVSTTFRYSDNPDELTFWNNANVSLRDSS